MSTTSPYCELWHTSLETAQTVKPQSVSLPVLELGGSLPKVGHREDYPYNTQATLWPT